MPITNGERLGILLKQKGYSYGGAAEMAGMSKQLVYYMVEALGATMAEFYEIEFDDKKE
jgi:transposase